MEAPRVNAAKDASLQGSQVLLLHGIARSPAALARLERTLQAQGALTLNLGLPTRRLPLEALARETHRALAGFVADGAPLHIVTHSMGGLVARAALTQHRPAGLGRVVMLGPPNAGSEVADLLARTWPYRRFFGPAGAQLVTCQDGALRRLLGTVDYPLGVIAGSRSIYPLASCLALPGPNDGRVTVAATRTAGMADHLVVPVAHPFLPGDPEVIRQVLHFLRQGRFSKARQAVRWDQPLRRLHRAAAALGSRIDANRP